MKKFFKIVGVVFGAFLVIGLFTKEDEKKSAKVETANIASVEPTETAEPAKPDVEILQMDESVESSINASTIHVKVRNNTDNLISYVDLKSVYEAKSGKIVGTGLGNATNIAAGETKVIDVTSMGVENADTYSVEVGNVMYE